jgi:hypothetical protein
MERNVVLKEVQIEVTFNVSGKKQISKWDFTDSENRYLKTNQVYRRYFQVPENIGSPVRIVAGSFAFVRQVTGATAQYPDPEREREQKGSNPDNPPSATHVIGDKPPSREGAWK